MDIYTLVCGDVYACFWKIPSGKIFTPQVVGSETVKNLTFFKKFFPFTILLHNFLASGSQKKTKKFYLFTINGHFLLLSCILFNKKLFWEQKKRADKTHLKWVTSTRRILDDSQFRIGKLYGFSQIQLYNERWQRHSTEPFTRYLIVTK